MTSSASSRAAVPPEQLRELFLFAHLSDERRIWLSRRGHWDSRPAGSPVYRQGELAEYLVVVLGGTVALRIRAHGDDIEISRTGQPGVYAGATQAYVDSVEQVYQHTLQAITDVELFLLPAADFADAVRSWFPMAVHLLEGLFLDSRYSGVLAGERERITALGTLAAGLTHELNNPVSAVVRANATLRERIRGMQRQLAALTGAPLGPSQLEMLAEVQEEALRQAGGAQQLSALQAADAEDDLADWLDEQDITEPWRLASTLAAGHLTRERLQQITASLPAGSRAAAIRWLACSVDIHLLLGDLESATGRIAGLIDTARYRAQPERVAEQAVDIRDLLDSALLGLDDGVRVLRVYQPVAPVLADPAELRQVFAALIDNAVQAMNGRGALTVSCSCDGEYVLVGIEDTGTGIPEEILPRVFEPFFTTRPVGQGMGLGLDLAYRLVVEHFHGDITVTSQPGDTRFRIVLPLTGLPVSAP
ncbi:ATP-binding protein [Streptomyces sp. NPDC126522]|uniref:ATP-binding protein n=1 Tax=Streptomyces sp. NPDC126522 TaxID=3155211 RepID=UPI003321A917